VKQSPALRIALLLPVLGASCTSAPTPAARPSPDRTATGSAGAGVWPLTPEGLRQELRHLARELHTIDLAGPPVRTDGWDENFQKAEWPLMAVAYYAYGCAHLAQVDQTIRSEALAEARWAVEALQSRRLSGFMEEHYGTPFADTPDRQGASVFLHGHFLNAALRYRDASGDERFDPTIRRVAEALRRAYASSPDGILSSYPTMFWLSDNFVALSGLARYGSAFDVDVSAAAERALRSVRAHYLEASTGLFATYVKPKLRRADQGPRGISVMYGVVFLKDFAPAFARDQWARARTHLVRGAMGLAAVREFPLGQEGPADGDSGPVAFGLGLSASGFAIPAAAAMGDLELGWSLMRAAAMLGAPVLEEDRLHYTVMPTVGQAVTFFGRVLLIHAKVAEK
jgi:hypothetical protein